MSLIHVDVNLSTGKVVSVCIRTSDPVEYLKQWVLTRDNINWSRYRLSFSGRELSGNKKISDYNIKDGQVLHVFKR